MHCVWRSSSPLLHEHLARRWYYLETVLGFFVRDDETILMKETRRVECIYDSTSEVCYVSQSRCFPIGKWPKASAFNFITLQHTEFKALRPPALKPASTFDVIHSPPLSFLVCKSRQLIPRYGRYRTFCVLNFFLSLFLFFFLCGFWRNF